MKGTYIAAALVFALSWPTYGLAIQFPVPNGHEMNADGPIGRAFRNRTSDVQVEGEGVVIRILADDLADSRHQRFLLRLASGQTLLIAHNIDIAPRVARLQESDNVRFFGEYVWNEKGGIIHWTHHDPQRASYRRMAQTQWSNLPIGADRYQCAPGKCRLTNGAITRFARIWALPGGNARTSKNLRQ